MHYFGFLAADFLRIGLVVEHTYRLIISCPDRVGIVAKVGQFVSSHGGWIVEANHYADPQSGFLCAIALKPVHCRLLWQNLNHNFKALLMSLKWTGPLVIPSNQKKSCYWPAKKVTA